MTRAEKKNGKKVNGMDVHERKRYGEILLDDLYIRKQRECVKGSGSSSSSGGGGSGNNGYVRNR